MVLSSQIARPDTLRRFATSRKRRHTLRNALIITFAIALVAWVVWPPGAAPTKATVDQPATGGDATSSLAVAGFSAVAGSSPVTQTPSPAAELEAMHKRAAAENARFDAFLRDMKAATTTPTVTPAITPSVTPATTPAPLPFTPAPAPAAAPAAAAAPDTPSLTLALAPTPSAAGHDIAASARRIAESAATVPGSAGTSYRAGMNQIADGKLIEGRRTLSKVLTSGDPSITASDARTIRDTLASINKSLVFSDRIVEGDTIATQHVVASGELLSVIARKYKISYQFIEQINSVDARRIRVGQKLKVIAGPLHAVVDKSDYRMDIFAKETDGTSIYITSFTVGIGKDDSTPIGSFICRSGGKLENPGWTHPRTGEHFGPDDPKNPIGEFWIALQGTDDHTKGVRGYGIHGTIEPDSVGKQASLGCVRMLAKDIEQVYKLLVDGQSTVTIQP